MIAKVDLQAPLLYVPKSRLDRNPLRRVEKLVKKRDWPINYPIIKTLKRQDV